MSTGVTKGGVAAPAIGVQLYSLRDRIAATGFVRVLEEVRAMGFAGVELAGLHDLSAAAFRDTLARLDLQLAAAHVPLPDRDGFTALLDAQAAIGAHRIVVAYQPPECFADAPAIARTAQRLNALAAAARRYGMTLGYHNHHWEFASRIDGRAAHDLLFAELDPDVFAEIDTYWARVGGADPVAVVAGFAGRAPLLHLKDGPLDDPRSPMTALGTGRMDIPALLAVSCATWHIVELDRCATDMLAAVRASHAFLARHA